ncbi:hypothetical protein JYT31_03170 [Beggiatoa alba]|nr:hypothetical protein [Beggiatoa alba]
MKFVIALMLFPQFLYAAEVEIKNVELRSNNGGYSWTFHVTLKHDDSGWEHYADAWRIVDEDGKVLGKRVLYHPHEYEQPFTRSLPGVKLAENAIIYIQAHDKRHGWSKDRVKIDFDFAEGDRYRIGEYGE